MHVKRLMEDRPSDWLEHLETSYSIKANRSGDFVSLKYNQIESPMHEPVVQECRGMVVDTVRRRVMAHPYNKFWNHGDAPAAEIDWSTARVFEKLDGSLMTLYWNDVTEGWQVASSGTPDACGSFGADDQRTFADGFWSLFAELGMRLPDADRRDTCFMFELCAAENRVVVRHAKPRIVLHGARDMSTGCELGYRDLIGIGEKYGWEVVYAYPITSIDEALAKAAEFEPLEHEGFVVADAAFNRVKIKSPRYVILHHMKGEATTRRAIELWQTGEAGELLSHFPEMEPAIRPVHDALDFASYAALLDLAKHRNAASRKEFAMAVKDAPWSATVFKLYTTDAALPSLADSKAVTRAMSMSALERLVEQVTPR
jgi:hypothetical protein